MYTKPRQDKYPETKEKEQNKKNRIRHAGLTSKNSSLRQVDLEPSSKRRSSRTEVLVGIY